MALRADDLDPGEARFDLGDRLQKSREWCGIKSADKMAELLNERRPGAKPIAGSTISAWERGANQPTRQIRVEDLIPLWVDICNESGAQYDPPRTTSPEFLWGLRTGSFSSELTGLPVPTGQASFLNPDMSVVDFYSRPFLSLV